MMSAYDLTGVLRTDPLRTADRLTPPLITAYQNGGAPSHKGIVTVDIEFEQEF